MADDDLSKQARTKSIELREFRYVHRMDLAELLDKSAVEIDHLQLYRLLMRSALLELRRSIDNGATLVDVQAALIRLTK